MVGQRPLEPFIGVRVPESVPNKAMRGGFVAELKILGTCPCGKFHVTNAMLTADFELEHWFYDCDLVPLEVRNQQRFLDGLPLITDRYLQP